MGITWFLPSHRLASVLKAPGEEKHALFSTLHLCPPCSLCVFPFLTFNELHLHSRVLRWILSHGTQRIWKSSDHRLHSVMNSSSNSSSFLFLFIFEVGSCYVAQAGLKLLPLAGIIELYCYAWCLHFSSTFPLHYHRLVKGSDICSSTQQQ
jgi:hypothetical protein